MGALLLASMYDTAGKPGKSAHSQSGTSPPAGARAQPARVSDEILARKAVVELHSGRRALAASHLEGRVRELLVTPGEEVDPEDPLAVIESPALRKTQLELLEATARKKWVANEVQRLRPSTASGLIARPQSRAAHTLSTLTWPVASSTLTSTACAA